MGSNLPGRFADHPLRLGTRDSTLALWQAQFVANRLQTHWPGLAVVYVTQKTLGDRFLEPSLVELGQRGHYGVFVKELEQTLLTDACDVAVHSLKDMPSVLPEPLVLQPVAPRERVEDAWLCPSGTPFEQLPAGSLVGTSSLRRVAQLSRLRPDLQYVPLRGNLQTRWRKLMAGEVAAMVLAAAGCHRLGWQQRITAYFDPKQVVPAVGQGVVAVEWRGDDEDTQALLAPLQDAVLEATVAAERAVMRQLEGGCLLPMGAYASPMPDGTLQLDAVLLSRDGAQQVREQTRVAPLSQAAQQGKALAERLLAAGGATIRAALRG